MTESSLIERITRSLAYMLRHKPEQFDLELDPHGYAPIGDVLHALTERLGERIHAEDLEEAVNAGERRRYEIVEDRVRALYGHSIPIEPGPESEPPEFLFLAIPTRDVAQAQRFGLRGGRRSFLHLALTPEEAIETGRRLAREYTLITVHAAEAFDNGVPFFDRKALFLAEELPTDFLEIGEAFDDGEEPERRGVAAGPAQRGRGPRHGERDAGRGASRGERFERPAPAPLPAVSRAEEDLGEEVELGSAEEGDAGPEGAGSEGAEGGEGGERRRRRRRGRRGRRDGVEGSEAAPEALQDSPRASAAPAAPLREATREPERGGWRAGREQAPAAAARDQAPGRPEVRAGRENQFGPGPGRAAEPAARSARGQEDSPRGPRDEPGRMPVEGGRGNWRTRDEAAGPARRDAGERAERQFSPAPVERGERGERYGREEGPAEAPGRSFANPPRERGDAPRGRFDGPREREGSGRESAPPAGERMGHQEHREAPRGRFDRTEAPREREERFARPGPDERGPRPEGSGMGGRFERGERPDRDAERSRGRFPDEGQAPRGGPPVTGRIERAEPRPAVPSAPRAPEPAPDEGNFGLGIFEAPAKPARPAKTEPPVVRPPAPRAPTPPPPPADDGFGTGIL